eukprot:UN01256
MQKQQPVQYLAPNILTLQDSQKLTTFAESSYREYDMINNNNDDDNSIIHPSNTITTPFQNQTTTTTSSSMLYPSTLQQQLTPIQFNYPTLQRQDSYSQLRQQQQQQRDSLSFLGDSLSPHLKFDYTTNTATSINNTNNTIGFTPPQQQRTSYLVPPEPISIGPTAFRDDDMMMMMMNDNNRTAFPSTTTTRTFLDSPTLSPNHLNNNTGYTNNNNNNNINNNSNNNSIYL